MKRNGTERLFRNETKCSSRKILCSAPAPPFVITGLDPVIHGAPPNRLLQIPLLRKHVDPRVKPEGDGGKGRMVRERGADGDGRARLGSWNPIKRTGRISPPEPAPPFGITGLDPVIHGVPPNTLLQMKFLRKHVDPRVKPEGDGGKGRMVTEERDWDHAIPSNEPGA